MTILLQTIPFILTPPDYPQLTSCFLVELTDLQENNPSYSVC